MNAVEKRCSKDFAEIIIKEQLLPIHTNLLTVQILQSEKEKMEVSIFKFVRAVLTN
jgi:hypothetical protein